MLTTKDKILEALLKGDKLTGLDGVNRWNTMALRNRIGELRREGHQISDEMIHHNGKHFKRYFIPKQEQMTLEGVGRG